MEGLDKDDSFLWKKGRTAVEYTEEDTQEQDDADGWQMKVLDDYFDLNEVLEENCRSYFFHLA